MKLPTRPGSEWTLGEPGLYTRVPENLYHADAALSNSQLSGMAGAKTPAHFHHLQSHPFESTAAMTFGTAVHHRILEAHSYADTYDVASVCCAEVKSTGAACKNMGALRFDGRWYCGVHSPSRAVKTLVADPIHALSPEDHQTIEAIHANVILAEAAHPLTEIITSDVGKGNYQDGYTELSLRWEDEMTGLMLRGRIDYISLDGMYLGDIKTTADASPDAWAKSVAKYGYHRQEAMYLRGMDALVGKELRDFRFILAESSMPGLVVVRALYRADVTRGNDELNDLLERYALCSTSGKWWGYDTTTVHVGGLPAWY
jgi:hypothetical protein